VAPGGRFHGIRGRALILTALALALAGCGGGKREQAASTRQSPATTCKAVPAPAPKADGTLAAPHVKLDPGKTYEAVVETNCGSFTIALDQKRAPATAASFVALARKRFFDGTIFHRIVPGFVIQGGDPTASGTGGPGYKTVDQPGPSTRYTKGVVAMAKTAAEAPGTAGSQFFVVTAADAGLPPEYAVLGTVTGGLGTVERIGKLGDAQEHPTETVEIEHVRIDVS
jgi:cyclophilin family peptidyl-prolyl cis-trans isomerase